MASVTLEFLAGQIAEPLDPDIDDLGRANVVTAKRRNGGEATVSEPAGPLGTVAVGPVPKVVDTNPASDADLSQHAAYHLALATEPGPRYPTIEVNLDANPALTAEVAALDIGDRLSLRSIPPELGQPSSDTLILGYTEVIGTHSRSFTFNSTRGGILFHVGRLDGDGGACLQTAGAQLDSAITDEQTAFAVYTTVPPLFTTSPPAGAKVTVRDREVMPVAGVASSLVDAFGRTVAGWGTSDGGQVWTASGSGSASVSGGFGRHVLTAGQTVLCSAGLSLATVDLLIGHTGISSPPAGDNVEVGARLRVTNGGNDYLQVRTFRQPGGAVTINLNQVVNGVQTAATGFPTVSGVTATDSIAIRVQPDDDEIRARAFVVGSDEPDTWQVTLAVTHLSPGDVTMRGMLGSSWSGASPLTIFWDNIEILNPQMFTVTRTVGERMAHPAGSDFRVARESALRLTL